MKKIFAVVLALVLCLSVFACAASADVSNVKLGVILLHDEDSTYDLNFINGVYEAVESLGLTEDQLIIKRNIPESNECYEAALDLVDEGCTIIFADSFGHETFMLQAAKECPDVEFCHATGTMAHTEKLANFHNAFAAIYEGRYLAGIAAGMKLNELKQNGQLKGEVPMMGYVGAFTYAEVISGYTSFFLGARSVCPTATMEVTFTGSWYDETAEKEGANKLIANGCKLISQHADSMGAPTACETKGVPNVSYNGSTAAACPNTFLVSSRIDWTPYFKHAIECTRDGKAIEADWTGTIGTGSVVLTDMGSAIAEGTEKAVEDAKKELEAGTRQVFDVSTFTVGGQSLSSYQADVDTDPAYTPDTEVIENGAFQESKFRSAPYFDLRIDGINLLDEAY